MSSMRSGSCHVRCMLQKPIQSIIMKKRVQIVVLAVAATAAVMVIAAYCRSRRRGGRQPVTHTRLHHVPVQESPDGRSGPSRVL